jgi:hypothetical protein
MGAFMLVVLRNKNVFHVCGIWKDGKFTGAVDSLNIKTYTSEHFRVVIK